MLVLAKEASLKVGMMLVEIEMALYLLKPALAFPREKPNGESWQWN